MDGYRILSSVSLAVYAFGALAFSALALTYWRERRERRKSGGNPVLPIFTVGCAAAFLLSLVREWYPLDTLGVAQDLITGVLPPMMVHLLYSHNRKRQWRWAVAGLYAAGIAAALGAEWSDRFENASAWVLAATGVVGIFVVRGTRAAA